MKKGDIGSMTVAEIAGWLTENGFPAFHARQIFSWIHRRFLSDFSGMTDLSAGLRAKLADDFDIVTVTEKQTLTSSSGGTVKYLYALPDGELIESVLLRYRYGTSVCVSTQVGCRMGCVFCASCKNGLTRNLTASEIEAQVIAARKASGARVSHVVMMGMGEPLDNFSAVIRAIRLLTDPNGLNIGARRISVSTCGIVPNIRALGERKLPVTLSVSLHAVTDARRSRLMPVNRVWNLSALLDACRGFQKAGGRRISFEYALIGGENDALSDADALADLLCGITAHVNLIPVNPAGGNGFAPPARRVTEAFCARLQSRGVAATVRRTLGADIDASCGQLRNRNLRKRGSEGT